MKLDFSDVKDNLMTEGKHHLTITGAKEGLSTNGNNVIVVDFKDENEAFVRDTICLEGPGAFKCQNFIKALGMSEDDFGASEASDLVGMELDAEIQLEEYNGEQRSKVKKYLAA